jgi:recombination protein RecA
MEAQLGKVLQMKKKAGKLSLDDMRSMINKSTGLNVAHDLKADNPTAVKDWIPTGSRWLDSIICKGKMAGIPVGKVTEIAGLSASGKSFMATQIAANAQKKGFTVVYFDAESSIDPLFLERAGVDLSKLLYVQAVSVEKTLEQIEALLTNYEDTQFLFIWDSIAATASEKDIEGDFNPQSSMAVKPRIFAKAFPKLTIPIANSQSAMILINQLKTNITSNVAEAMTTPFIAPGGKAIEYFCSLRIWLTRRKARASFVENEKGVRVGSETKVKIEKSRFGSYGRTCAFKILWGDDVGIQDEESWLEAIKLSGTDRLKRAGAWYTIVSDSGKEFKFQGSKWTQQLKDEEFRNTVYDIMDKEIIEKYDTDGSDINVDSE